MWTIACLAFIYYILHSHYERSFVMKLYRILYLHWRTSIHCKLSGNRGLFIKIQITLKRKIMQRSFPFVTSVHTASANDEYNVFVGNYLFLVELKTGNLSLTSLIRVRGIFVKFCMNSNWFYSLECFALFSDISTFQKTKRRYKWTSSIW